MAEMEGSVDRIKLDGAVGYIELEGSVDRVKMDGWVSNRVVEQPEQPYPTPPAGYKLVIDYQGKFVLDYEGKYVYAKSE